MPIFHFHSSNNPILTDFFSQVTINKNLEEEFKTENLERKEVKIENPVRLQNTAFPVNWSSESKENFEILQSIVNCKNEQIFMTPFIQYFIKLQ